MSNGHEPIVWTEEHRREALLASHGLLRPIFADGHGSIAAGILVELVVTCGSEQEWRAALRKYLAISYANIEREVRRVDALATGRLVRETSWGVRRGNANAKKWKALRGRPLRTREDVHAAAREFGVVPMRITRIRRAR